MKCLVPFHCTTRQVHVLRIEAEGHLTVLYLLFLIYQYPQEFVSALSNSQLHILHVSHRSINNMCEDVVGIWM